MESYAEVSISRSNHLTKPKKINLGIAGAGGRGGSFKRSIDRMNSIRIHAVCDTDVESLEDAAGRLGASEAYADFDEMLESPDVEAVLVGTPMPYHASPVHRRAGARDTRAERGSRPQSPVEECRQIVDACKRSSAVYMMAENYCYTRPNQVVKQMVSEGVFGKPYYAEGEYIHELKATQRDHEMAPPLADRHRRHHLRDTQPRPNPPVDARRSRDQRKLRRQRPQPRRPARRPVRKPGLLRDALQDGLRRPRQNTR